MKVMLAYFHELVSPHSVVSERIYLFVYTVEEAPHHYGRTTRCY
jgi:hypothetical protein